MSIQPSVPPLRRLGAMQPYFFPYLGYFQLIRAVDVFVVLNRVQYTKRGWINRNFLLGTHNHPKRFTLSIQKGGHREPIQSREISPEAKNKNKIIHAVRHAYQKTPQYEQVMPGLEKAIGNPDLRLDRYLLSCLRSICQYLGLSTPMVLESELEYPSFREKSERLIALSNLFQANEYVNPIGGKDLYSYKEFEEQGIQLAFLKLKPITYKQFFAPFVPNLSIIDVLMFNPPEKITWLLEQFDLIEGKQQASGEPSD